MGDPRMNIEPKAAVAVALESGPIGTRPHGTLPTNEYARLGASLRANGLDESAVADLLNQTRLVVETAVVHACDRVASAIYLAHAENYGELVKAISRTPRYAGLCVASHVEQVVHTHLRATR